MSSNCTTRREDSATFRACSGYCHFLLRFFFIPTSPFHYGIRPGSLTHPSSISYHTLPTPYPVHYRQLSRLGGGRECCPLFFTWSGRRHHSRGYCRHHIIFFIMARGRRALSDLWHGGFACESFSGLACIAILRSCEILLDQIFAVFLISSLPSELVRSGFVSSFPRTWKAWWQESRPKGSNKKWDGRDGSCMSLFKLPFSVQSLIAPNMPSPPLYHHRLWFVFNSALVF